MTALGKLFRTTAFKLSLAYLAIFAIGSGIVLFRLGTDVKELLDDQIRATVEAEIRGLAEQYASGGIRKLAETIEQRSRQPGSSLFLLTTNAGEPLTGNVYALPPNLDDQAAITEIAYQRAGSPGRRHPALAEVFSLENGLRLLVGRDLEERERLRSAVLGALATSLVSIAFVGLVGGLFVSRRVLKRIDGMTASTRTIMAGDLSGRLPIAGTGDELDRLAGNLNHMLGRIGVLLTGLKEVTDNIAHDLKTPLTRLRNGAEQALRRDDDPQEHRRALENTIAESDALIGIFNAILLIARAEAGSVREGMMAFDAAEVVRDIGELYEPVAEERGVAFDVVVDGELPVYGNRELLGQALVNLVDNAFKYGVHDSVTPAAELRPSDLQSADLPPANTRATEALPMPEGVPLGHITVRAGKVAGGLEVAVCDGGEGIGAADRARALERFVRLEGARSKPGSGLGLSLVAAIARLHDGSLRLADNNPGLCAVLTLPLRAEPGGASRPQPAPPPAA